MNLFVSGLTAATTEKELRELFEKYGTVESTKVMLDPHTGIPRGFGFVLFQIAADAQRALAELNGTHLGAGTLHISVSQHDGRAEQTTRVYVRNIPSSCTEDAVRQYFEEYGTVRDMVLRPDTWSAESGSMLTQQVTIEYEQTEGARSAVETVHGKRPWGGDSPLLAKFAESAHHRANKRMKVNQPMLNAPPPYAGGPGFPAQQQVPAQPFMASPQYVQQPMMVPAYVQPSFPVAQPGTMLVPAPMAQPQQMAYVQNFPTAIPQQQPYFAPTPAVPAQPPQQMVATPSPGAVGGTPVLPPQQQQQFGQGSFNSPK